MTMLAKINEERKEAYAEGQQQGRNTRNYEIARDMIRDGEPVEKIVRYSQLTAEEILKLRSEMDSASA